MVAVTLEGSFGSARFDYDCSRYNNPGDAEAKQTSEPYARRQGLREGGRKEVLP